MSWKFKYSALVTPSTYSSTQNMYSVQWCKRELGKCHLSASLFFTFMQNLTRWVVLYLHCFSSLKVFRRTPLQVNHMTVCRRLRRAESFWWNLVLCSCSVLLVLLHTTGSLEITFDIRIISSVASCKGKHQVWLIILVVGIAVINTFKRSSSSSWVCSVCLFVFL